MKLAVIIGSAGVILAAAVWFLSGSNAESLTVQRTAVAPQFAPGLARQATSSSGNRAIAAEGSVSADMFGEVAIHTPVSAKKTSREGDLPQTRGSGAFNDPALSLPVTTATRGQPVEGAAPARGNELLPQQLIPAMVAEESSVAAPLSVPSGARFPALFLDDRPLPSVQRRILDRIANEFIDAVAGDPSGQNRALWENAREAADKQYIKLYGHAAYNALHMQAAKEAVREQRATATPTAP